MDEQDWRCLLAPSVSYVDYCVAAVRTTLSLYATGWAYQNSSQGAGASSHAYAARESCNRTHPLARPHFTLVPTGPLGPRSKDKFDWRPGRKGGILGLPTAPDKTLSTIAVSKRAELHTDITISTLLYIHKILGTGWGSRAARKARCTSLPSTTLSPGMGDGARQVYLSTDCARLPARRYSIYPPSHRMRTSLENGHPTATNDLKAEISWIASAHPTESLAAMMAEKEQRGRPAGIRNGNLNND